MADKRVTDLASASNASLTDIIMAVQGYVSPSNVGNSVQETLQQVFTLFLANTILNHPGNPNGAVAGVTYQLCWDTSNLAMYVCSTGGTATTAVWTVITSTPVTYPISAANGGTGVSSPTAHTIPVAEGASAFNFLGPLTNGQVLIGSTGSDPVPATLTAGAGISIANAAGSITISGTASSIGWNVITGNTNAVVENGYICNSASPLTVTLPVTAAVGTAIAVANFNTGGFTIAQNANQNIRIGSTVSTTGVGGSVASSAQGDAIYLVCVVANTSWMVINAPEGNFTVT